MKYILAGVIGVLGLVSPVHAEMEIQEMLDNLLIEYREVSSCKGMCTKEQRKAAAHFKASYNAFMGEIREMRGKHAKLERKMQIMEQDLGLYKVMEQVCKEEFEREEQRIRPGEFTKSIQDRAEHLHSLRRGMH